ncbi:MAG TPA: response regulator [Thermoanaerobaculia bacterium]|jgi:CheY-like chemotaxis protein
MSETDDHPRPWPRLLVVDDDEPARRLIATLLSRHGFEIVEAVDGEDAIRQLETSGPFVAIVLDLMMPRMDGRGVIAYVREEQPQLPVIVCTAADPATYRDLDGTIVRGVIRKPFDIDELTATIAAVAGRMPPRVKVLIVDDDFRARYVLRAFIGPAEISEAERGRDTFALIRRSRPDVILLDLMLPDTPGEDLLLQLREDPETTDIPVIVVTSRRFEEPADRAALLRQASGIIYKGDLSRETLAAAVQGAVSGDALPS